MKKDILHYAGKIGRFLKRNGAICAAGACALMVGIVFALSTANNTGPEPTTPSSIPVQEVMVRKTPTETAPSPQTTVAATKALPSPETEPAAKEKEMIWPVQGLIQT